ncbi:MAG TPA: threonine synthase [Nitrososphaerales archaeon]
MKLKCISCSREYPIDEMIYYCKSCNDLLEVVYDKSELEKKASSSEWRKLPLSVWRYHPFLPFKDGATRIALNEGGTGLHKCERLAAFLGLKTIHIKNEGENPTGSFKDRGMTVGVSKALELGVSWVICASTGNTSASLAAYAARAGLKRIVLIPSGKVAYGKLAQAMMCGAQVVQVKGNFDEALEMVMDLAERYKDVYLLNSVNPFRLEGQKTLAFEVCEQLGHVPDWIVVPVGNAGNISAIWKGLQEFKSLGYISKLPRMVGVQAAGAAPIAEAFEKGSSEIKFIEKPETIATAIRIGAPQSWKKALKAIHESNGLATKVTDEEILSAQGSMAKLEGIFVEPASATPVAAAKNLIRNGTIKKDDEVVCVATGHGLKDPDVITKFFEKPIEVEADIKALEHILGLS